jgi:AraC-like DNA-binding protein
MVHAVRQYGRWLRDNYADLEHKEVWQSFVVLAIMLLVFVIYAFTSEGVTFLYTMQVIVAVLVCYLLWRVETLSDLSLPVNDAEEVDTVEKVEDPAVSLSMRNNIGPLLKKHCEESRFYLEYDISLSRLAREIGINRHYLSQYFSSLGMNYNAYINDLRINHFVSLYREAVNSNRSVTAKQLALECGYHSYSTFCYIIKRKTGLSVTAWMKGLGDP